MSNGVIFKMRGIEVPSQNGGTGKNTLLPRINKRRITTKLKTKTTRTARKIKLRETPTTKEINVHPDWLEGQRQASRLGGCTARLQTVQVRGCWQTGHSHILVSISQEEQQGSARQTGKPRASVWKTKDSKPLAVKTCGGL